MVATHTLITHLLEDINADRKNLSLDEYIPIVVRFVNAKWCTVGYAAVSTAFCSHFDMNAVYPQDAHLSCMP